MSSSDSRMEGQRGTGRLVVTPPFGFSVTVADSGFSMIGEACWNFDANLPDGVYTVCWSDGERHQRWIVRLKAGATHRIPEDAGPGELDGAPEDPRLESVISEIERRQESGRQFVHVVLPRLPVGANHVGPVASLWKGNRQVDHSRKVALNVHSAYPTVASVPTSAGAHVLRFTHGTRRLAQTLYVPEGRSTVVIFGEDPRDMRHPRPAGIYAVVNPSATVVASLAPGAPAVDIWSTLLSARALLHRLRDRPLQAGLPGQAGGIPDDPYLRLYTAANVLALPGQVIDRLATVLSTDFETGPGAVELAADFLKSLSIYQDWPDVLCLHWRVLVDIPSLAAPKTSLSLPPMLDICWRWLSAQSARECNPETDKLLKTFAGRGLPGQTPWFATTGRASAKDARASHDDSESRAGLQSNLSRLVGSLEASKTVGGQLSVLNHIRHGQVPWLATTLRAFANDARAVDDGAPGTGLLPNLSPRIEASTEVGSQLEAHSHIRTAGGHAYHDRLELDGGRVIHAILGSGGTQAWTDQSRDPVAQLAASLGKPAFELAPAVAAAANIMSRYIESAPSPAGPADDPNKGAFGGLASRPKGTLSLESFERFRDSKYLSLKFSLTLSKKLRSRPRTAVFHLHPTFMPSQEHALVENGKATLSIHAWGAFTLGVEVGALRLELDLAEDPRLPDWFRAL